MMHEGSLTIIFFSEDVNQKHSHPSYALLVSGNTSHSVKRSIVSRQKNAGIYGNF